MGAVESAEAVDAAGGVQVGSKAIDANVLCDQLADLADDLACSKQRSRNSSKPRTSLAANVIAQHCVDSSSENDNSDSASDESDGPYESSLPGACPAPAVFEAAGVELRTREEFRVKFLSKLNQSGAWVPSVQRPPRHQTVIIFDWDDTLCPTSYILQNLDAGAVVDEDHPAYEELVQHAHLVGFILRTTRRIARVAIVTNSLSPWVLASGARYLPGLDLKHLLDELDIPVYYSRSHIEEVQVNWVESRFEIRLDHKEGTRVGIDVVPSQTDGSLRISRIEPDGLVGKWNAANPALSVLLGDSLVTVNGQKERLASECRKLQVLEIEILRLTPDRDPLLEAKRIDMTSCVDSFYPDPTWRRNVLSIGDSYQEQQAIKEVLPRSGDPSKDPLCKTVNLIEHPSLQVLGSELRVLLVWMIHMVRFPNDFDLSMDGLDALEKKLFST
mmetsp:Transcript_71912/g.185485  ORF Transcript_71912/g.185485 Transcript_71912/m.185485 type:complete len:444 (-) Transcript_71912:208-1539(-)